MLPQVPGRRSRRSPSTPVPSCELLIDRARRGHSTAFSVTPVFPLLAAGVIGGGALFSVSWMALKIGALSYGGGFVIIPLMQADAVDHYHWMTGGQFLNAVALGQITPGPVVQTVAVVGYAAAGLTGGLLASLVAFAPSFAIGAILGSAVPLALAISEPWQYAVLVGAAVLLLLPRRNVVLTLLVASTAGTVIALAGGTLPT